MLLNYLSKNKLHLISFVILAPINSTIEVGLAYVMSSAIDYALDGNIADLKNYVIAFSAYVLLSFIIGFLCAKSKIRLLATTMAALKSDLHQHIMEFPTGIFQSRNSSDYLAKLTVNADAIRDSWYAVFLEIYPTALKFIFATIAMFFCNSILGIYVIFFAIIQALIPSLFTTRISERGKTFALEQEHYVSIVKENFLSFTTAKVFDIVYHLNIRHKNQAKSTTDAWCESKTMNRLSFELSFAIGNVIYLGIYLIGAILVLKNQMTLPSIIAASQLMVYIASPLTTISGDIAEIKSNSKIVADFNKILTTIPKEHGKTKKHQFEHDIVLDSISFSYNSRPIFSDVSYRFKKGGKYVILGDSGSGKSTLLKLIAQIYDCNSGKILIDGLNIAEIHPKDYFSLIGCVPQEPFLFDSTIAQNIQLFKETSKEDLLEVLDKVELTNYIENLPNGIYSNVGENAMQMSGGEKQRLSIARVLLNHCSVLLLDEFTSQLDAKTASEIEQFVFSLPDVTVLFVTHNIHKETIAIADKVIEIKDGNLIERKDMFL